MSMQRAGIGLSLLCAASVVATVAACESSADSGATQIPSGADYDGGGSSTNLEGGSSTQDGSAQDGATPSAPRDPFQAQWTTPPDFPDSTNYLVDQATGTVTDKTTGLVWSQKALSADDLPDGGNEDPETQVQALAACASATIGGATGWRLPTRMELLSILTLDENHTHEPTAFDSSTLDNLPLWARTEDTSRNAYYEGHYHVHTFHANLVGTWASGQVHCVKAPYPITDHAQAPEASRFTVSDKVLSDHVTHLEWFTSLDNTARQWTDASTYCANLATAGVGAPAGSKPWRLPTLKEGASLWLETSKGFPAAFGIDGAVYFWTASHYTPPSNVIANPGYFRLTFDGQKASGDFYWDVNDFASTLCVRDGS